MGTMTGIQWLGCGGQEQVTTWLWLRKGRVNHKFLPSRSGSVMIIFSNSGYRIFIQSRIIITCYLPIPCYSVAFSVSLSSSWASASRMSLRFVRKGGGLWSIIATYSDPDGETLTVDCIDMQESHRQSGEDNRNHRQMALFYGAKYKLTKSKWPWVWNHLDIDLLIYPCQWFTINHCFTIVSSVFSCEIPFSPYSILGKSSGFDAGSTARRSTAVLLHPTVQQHGCSPKWQVVEAYPLVN